MSGLSPTLHCGTNFDYYYAPDVLHQFEPAPDKALNINEDADEFACAMRELGTSSTTNEEKDSMDESERNACLARDP